MTHLLFSAAKAHLYGYGPAECDNTYRTMQYVVVNDGTITLYISSGLTATSSAHRDNQGEIFQDVGYF